MTTDKQAHAPRQRFDTLFIDPHHYRADCRMVRTAIRRGWLDNLPEADRKALVDRLTESTEVREGAKSESQRDRGVIAQAWALLEMTGQDQRDMLRVLRYCWADEWTGRTTGRPRE